MSLKDAIDRLGLDYKDNGSEEVKLRDCPFCGNDNYKVWINVKTKLAHCWRCDQGGTARYFLSKFGKVQCLEEPKTLEITQEKRDISKISLPIEAIDFRDARTSVMFDKALDYLVNKRGLTIDDIYKYNLHYCDSGKYSGYIIIPIYDLQGHLVDWQGRRYFFCGKKSMNPIGSKHLFNIQGIKENALILVEGPFDVIRLQKKLHILGIEIRVVGLLGHSLSANQLAKIAYEIKPNLVILMLDSDVNKDEISLALELKKYGIENVLISQLSSCDPDELTEEQIIDILNNLKDPQELAFF